MNIKKNISAILILVLILAMGFQTLRSNFLLNLLNNSTKKSIAVSYTSAEIPSNVSKETFLVLFDSNEPNSISIRDNVIKSLNYMKKKVVSLDVTKETTFDKSNTSVIITFEQLSKLKNLSSLMDYVKSGGNLLFAERPLVDSSFKSISSILGIDTLSANITTEGIKLLKNVLIKGTDIIVDGSIMKNSSIKLTLNDQAKILARSNEDIPLLWAIPYNNGRIMFFNGTALDEKLNRGLLVGTISLLIPNFIYPIMNSKLIYIDDFHNPDPNDINNNIYRDYKINTAEFYRDIWWPDILRLGKYYNLKYTASFVENYSNKTTPPFVNNNIDNTSSFLLYGRELIQSGGELGITGYNQQPLALTGYIKQNSGYTPWSSKTDMEASLSQVYNYIKSNYRNYPIKVYVPPSNILSPEGKQAVINALPDLKIISSTYVSNDPRSYYTQEFEFKDEIYEFPRLTSGYNNDSYTQWAACNGITSMGIFSHFIQPYDVLYSKQGDGESWTKLFRNFNALLTTIDTKFSWLDPYTSSQGAELLKSYTDIDPYIEYDENKITVYCKNLRENSSFILRSTENLHSSKDCSFYKIDNGVYLINAKKPVFSIKIGR